MSIPELAQTDEATTEQWVKGSCLYNRWRQIKQEILLHKWYESEKAGHDIGWEHAAADWWLRYGPSLDKGQDKPRLP